MGKVAFEVRLCPRLCLPLPLSRIRTPFLWGSGGGPGNVAWCPPASWPPDQSQLQAFWGHDLALTQQQKFGFLKMKCKSTQ